MRLNSIPNLIYSAVVEKHVFLVHVEEINMILWWHRLSVRLSTQLSKNHNHFIAHSAWNGPELNATVRIRGILRYWRRCKKQTNLGLVDKKLRTSEMTELLRCLTSVIHFERRPQLLDNMGSPIRRYNEVFKIMLGPYVVGVQTSECVSITCIFTWWSILYLNTRKYKLF